MTFPVIPTLATERLVLRAPEAADFEPYAAFMAGTRAGFLGGPLNRRDAWRSFAGVLGHWALRGFGRWTAALRDSGQAVGLVGLHYPESWPEPEIAWALFEGCEGRGLACEAAGAVRAHVFGAMGWGRVISLIHVDNARSAALARRLGAVPERAFTHPDFGEMTVWRHAPGGGGDGDA